MIRRHDGVDACGQMGALITSGTSGRTTGTLPHLNTAAEVTDISDHSGTESLVGRSSSSSSVTGLTSMMFALAGRLRLIRLVPRYPPTGGGNEGQAQIAHCPRADGSKIGRPLRAVRRGASSAVECQVCAGRQRQLSERLRLDTRKPGPNSAPTSWRLLLGNRVSVPESPGLVLHVMEDRS